MCLLKMLVYPEPFVGRLAELPCSSYAIKSRKSRRDLIMRCWVENFMFEGLPRRLTLMAADCFRLLLPAITIGEVIRLFLDRLKPGWIRYKVWITRSSWSTTVAQTTAWKYWRKFVRGPACASVCSFAKFRSSDSPVCWFGPRGWRRGDNDGQRPPASSGADRENGRSMAGRVRCCFDGPKVPYRDVMVQESNIFLVLQTAKLSD